MASTYYTPDTQRAKNVERLFASVARRYDLVNDLQSMGMHRLWKQRFAAMASPAPGKTILDLCCGTGDIALRLARAGASVTALDFSPAMLNVARHRSTRLQCGRAKSIEFVEGDALQLPFPDARFDAVTIAYGLRNLSDWKHGLREMARVAKPGAPLLVLDFGKPDNAVWRQLYFAYLRGFVPLLGRLFFGDAALYAYILESLAAYPAQHGVDEEMRRMGCVDSQIHLLMGGAMSINRGFKPLS